MKTIYQFDYDLWAVDGKNGKKYFARIKSTGEESEISLEVMRILMNEEKKMRRKLNNGPDSVTVLSIDYIDREDERNQYLNDSYDLEDEVITRDLEKRFVKTLTQKQKEMYFECKKSGKSLHEYAAEKHISYSSVQEMQEAIRKKFRKIYS